MLESMSSSPDTTLSSESVNTEVVSLTKSSSCSSLPVGNEVNPVEVFMLRFDCSQEEEILSLLTEPSPSSEVIYFDWINLTESHLHSSVPFQIYVRVTGKSILCTIIEKGLMLALYPLLLGKP